MTTGLRIGTRGSRLALVQSEWVRNRLHAAHPDLRAELVVIKTSGDRIRDVPLHAVGGKALFVKELEAALVEGTIDCAVHSLKDVPAQLEPGLVIAAVPEREVPYDVVVTRQPGGLAALPAGARVGTSSPRRAALLRALAPRLAVVDLRGNVDTRLAKLDRQAVDALMLAAAGLHRLGLDPPHTEPCDPAVFVPAVGQGALALECRAGPIVERLAAIEHAATRRAVDAERTFLIAVGGSCITPLAAHATLAGDHLVLRALLAHPSGHPVMRGEITGAAADASRLGTALAEQLLAESGPTLRRALGLPA